MQELVIPHWDQLPELTWKQKIGYLTYRFLKLEQAETPVRHLFEKGVYIREMLIPKDTLFLGRAHQHGHECQLLIGSVLHISEEGRRQVDAPFAMHTTPGYHMVLYALTDVVGRTIHPNPEECRDVQKLEDDIFESTEALALIGQSVHEQLEHVCLE